MPPGAPTAGFAGAMDGFVTAGAGAVGFTEVEDGFGTVGTAGFGPEVSNPPAAAGLVMPLAGVFEPSDLISDLAGWPADVGLTTSFSFNSLTGSFWGSWALVSGAGFCGVGTRVQISL